MSRKSTSTLDAKEEKTSRCSHYWMIEDATGPVSKGVCKLCGQEREFVNFLGEGFWERSISTEDRGADLSLPSVGDIAPEDSR